MNKTLGRLLGLHQALWNFDPWYRRAWFIAPQALSLTALVVLLVPGDLPPPAAAEWAKPTSSAEPQASTDYQLCADESADYKQRGMACDRLISIGTLADPELSVAYLGRGVMRYKDNQPELAIADDTEAIKHDPNNAGAHDQLGAFSLDKNDLANALRDFNEAIRINPEWAQPRASKAETLRRQGELTEALAEVNKALEIDQNLDWARSVRDAIQADIKRVEVQGKQTTVKTSTDYQLCVDESADYKQRGMACDRLISLGTLADPELSVAYLWRGWMRYKDNQPELAIADYNKAIELNSKDAFAYGSRGIAYRAKGDEDRAIADYNKAIELNPNDATTYYNRGISFDTKGEHDRAIADYNKAIELNPKDADAYDSRGRSYYARGDHDRAIADYNKAIELNPKDAFAYENRGRSYDTKGDHDRAIADYNKAIELNPMDAFAYNELGAFLLDENDLANALRDFNEAIRTNPAWALPRANRAEVFRRQGKLPAALADANKALEIDQNLDWARSVHDAIQADIQRLEGGRRDRPADTGVDTTGR